MTRGSSRDLFGNIEFNLKQLVDELLLVSGEIPDSADLRPKARTKRELENLSLVISRLEALNRRADPVHYPDNVFDPSDPRTVGRLIAQALLEEKKLPLSGLQKFYGSGVYAIYYHGNFDAYRPASSTETPLYVGKVDPKSPEAESPVEQGTKLWGRLNEHKKSIEAANNLDIDDFWCRYLVVKSAWQNTAETYLISIFKPVWNNETNICFGIGKHGDSAATRGNTRSPWDELHPGRAWAKKKGNKKNPLSPKEIEMKILAHYQENRPIKRLPRLRLTQTSG